MGLRASRLILLFRYLSCPSLPLEQVHLPPFLASLPSPRFHYAQAQCFGKYVFKRRFPIGTGRKQFPPRFHCAQARCFATALLGTRFLDKTRNPANSLKLKAGGPPKKLCGFIQLLFFSGQNCLRPGRLLNLRTPHNIRGISCMKKDALIVQLKNPLLQKQVLIQAAPAGPAFSSIFQKRGSFSGASNLCKWVQIGEAPGLARGAPAMAAAEVNADADLKQIIPVKKVRGSILHKFSMLVREALKVDQCILFPRGVCEGFLLKNLL